MMIKTEPASARIKTPLEVLSTDLFNLYYMKGKAVRPSNFLSQMKVHKSNHHEIIPILLDLQEGLQEKYYICTMSEGQEAGNTMGKVHGHDKPLQPHMKPEKAAKYYLIYLVELQLTSVTNIIIRRVQPSSRSENKV